MMRQSLSLGHYSPVGEKTHNINSSFSSQFCVWWNAQIEEQGIRVFCTVFGPYSEHTNPVPFALFSPPPPRAGRYVSSPPFPPDHCSWIKHHHCLHCSPSPLTVAPSHSLDKVSILCTSVQCPPSAYSSTGPHPTPNTHKPTAYKGSFCFGQAVSPLLSQGTMNCPLPATPLKLPSHP